MGTYALVIAGAAAAALLLMLLLKKKTGIKAGTAFIFGAFAVPCCILLGRAAFWLCSIEWIRNSNLSFWDFLGSGYSYMLYGAVLGGFAAAFLTAKVNGESFGRVADAAAAPAALLIAAGRFGEYIIKAGFGSGVMEWFDPYEMWSMIPWEDPEPICRLPFAMQIPPYNSWRFAINLWEGLAAVAFLIILIVMKKRRSGGAATLLLLGYASCQILFESMRKDEVIIWGFVKANQLISALLVLGILIFCWLKQPKETRKQGELWLRTAMVLIAAGIVMMMEFALDQKINFLLWMHADLSYIVMAACCIWMLLTVLPLWRKAWPKQDEA